MAENVTINFTEDKIDNKYGTLDQSIVQLLKAYEIEYFREDKPVPFCGLMVYPATVHDYENFSNCCSIFTLNKNEDPKGIRMSHLDYLISKTQIKENNEGQIWSFKIQKMFEIIFHIQNGLKCKKCSHIISYDSKDFVDFVHKITDLQKQDKNNITQNDIPKLVCPECQSEEFVEMIKIIQDQNTKKYSLLIDGQVITKDDFNFLRQLVLYQNFPDYVDDSWVDPEVKKDHDEKLRLEHQKSNVNASIENKAIGLSITTNYKLNEIFDMSIRKFTLTLSMVDDLINYKIMKQAAMSGFVSLPKGKNIEHWLYKSTKDMYGDSYKSTDEVHNEVSNL